MTETILDDSAVSEIEARHKVAASAFQPYKEVSDSLSDIPTLCATVKHLRITEKTLQGQINRLAELAETRSDLIAAKAAHVDQLQSQLEQLRAERERERTICKAANELIVNLDNFRSRAIQLCKDKAAEYERQLSGDIGIVTAATLNAQKQTASELAAELEKL